MMLSIVILTYVVLIFAFAFTPYATRKTELFGINIPSSETRNPKANKLRRNYRDIIIISGVLFLVVQIILFVLPNVAEQTQVNVFVILLFVYMALCFFIYLLFHNKMKKLKEKLEWNKASKDTVVSNEIVVDTAPINNDVIPAKWLFLYPLIAAITILCIIFVWPFIPAEIPMQIGFDGEVSRWAAKSIQTIILIISSQWLILFIMAVVYFIMKNAKRQIDVAEPEASKVQGSRFRHILSACMVFGGAILGAIMGLMFILMFLNASSKFITMVPLIILVLTIVFVVVLYTRIGQGGSRLASSKVPNNSVVNRDDDKYWKLGVFYFNKEDPAVFVEKRFGLGYTNNFARPLSWIIFLGLVAVIVVFTIVTIKLTT